MMDKIRIFEYENLFELPLEKFGYKSQEKSSFISDILNGSTTYYEVLNYLKQDKCVGIVLCENLVESKSKSTCRFQYKNVESGSGDFDTKSNNYKSSEHFGLQGVLVVDVEKKPGFFLLSKTEINEIKSILDSFKTNDKHEPNYFASKYPVLKSNYELCKNVPSSNSIMEKLMYVFDKFEVKQNFEGNKRENQKYFENVKESKFSFYSSSSDSESDYKPKQKSRLRAKKRNRSKRKEVMNKICSSSTDYDNFLNGFGQKLNLSSVRKNLREEQKLVYLYLFCMFPITK